ncbi:MAG TPA: hypothetical protein VNL77_15530, partial [Roseiflexaceae bacterium]|nr:hypothetical protein [Roseiflexaceae bacterium]
PPLRLTFARTRAPNVVRFKVALLEEEQAAAAPAPVTAAPVSSDAPPARRPGRPRKTAGAEPAPAASIQRGRKPRSA